MRKLMMAGLALCFLYACGNNAKTGSSADTTEKKEAAKPEDPEVEKGLNLVATNDCFGCHQVSAKINGPAYQEVAMRYKDSAASIADTLVQRVIKGSTGHWGEAQMTPHPTVPVEDVKAMVKYVLSLKQ